MKYWIVFTFSCLIFLSCDQNKDAKFFIILFLIDKGDDSPAIDTLNTCLNKKDCQLLYKFESPERIGG